MTEPFTPPTQELKIPTGFTADIANERDKVIARTAERNAWLEKLWASLEGVE